MVLDCQNEKSALQSIALYFKTDVESIKSTFIKNNLKKLFRMYYKNMIILVIFFMIILVGILV